MKPASLAPFYGCLYPGLCDIARAHGYALAIHGSVSRDLDLTAIPWTEDCASEETVVKAILDHARALSYPDLLRRDCPSINDEHIDQIVKTQGGYDPKPKPHGRKAWSLHLYFGGYIDLSVMPCVRASPAPAPSTPFADPSASP